MASQVEVTIRNTITRMINASASINRRFKNPFREHLFLSGIHAPMTEELLLEALRVTGELPATLTGTYARIGPNPYKVDPR
ncbi:MAG: carotenoid oxygenase family protein, partial [Luminiphilus sp.]|nr:carotenoid oxygenase family protein [Luminiphilus sp.]